MADPKYKDIGSPLTKAVEECSEVIKIACKIDRFGWFNYHPDDPNKTPNIELLKREMGDVVESFNVLEKAMAAVIRDHYESEKVAEDIRRATKCHKCAGKGYTEHYHDAGDHFGAGTSPFSEWVREPCKTCNSTGKV